MDAATVEGVFRSNGIPLDEKLAEECASICRLYEKSADDLMYKIQSINFTPVASRSGFIPVTMDTVSEARKQFQQELRAKENPNTRKAITQLGGTLMTAQIDRSKLPKQFSSRPTTLIKEEESSSIMAHSTVNVSFVGPRNDPEARRTRAYRYMYEKMSERSESLDQLIDDVAELIRMHYDIKADFGDPSATTDEEVIIVGRITHDAETATTSKLVEGEIVIESSRILSGGARVPLRLEPSIKIRGGVRNAGGFGLFPGAIAAFKGKNGGGGYFLATEYLSIPPLKPSPAALGIVNPKLDPSASQNPVSMLIACGPFTSDADLMFKPLRTIFRQIDTKKPDILLLIGPFVDSAHPKIKNGDMDVPPSNLFKVHVMDRLKSFMDASPGSVVLIVPSVRDLISDHPVFPQREFSEVHDPSLSRLHMLPNPARFMINDIAFATTSVDTLFHLRKEEYFKRGVEIESLAPSPDDLPNDVMAGLCRHLLLQRSFYPIFPPPQDLSAEVNLDMTHIDGGRMVDNESDLDYAPDVLILPSRLKQFSKVLHSTTMINPSFLSKGTYATISIAPRSHGTPKQRVKAEILKIEFPTPGASTAAQPTAPAVTA